MVARLRPRRSSWVLAHQRTTLLVTLATVALTGAARGGRAQGLLPAAGHRAHPRRLRGAARRLVRAHDGAAAARSPTWCCSDPDVATVASFIGADGTNPTHQQRPPLDHAQAARASAAPTPSEIIARLQPKLAAGRRASRSTCSRCRTCRSTRRVSRTQYQYTLEDADPDELARVGAARARAAARAARAARRRQRSADAAACSSRSTIDRDTAARLGVTPQAIDDTLYDAFGQRRSRPSSPSSTCTA